MSADVHAAASTPSPGPGRPPRGLACLCSLLAACLQAPAPPARRTAPRDAGPPDAATPPSIVGWEIRDRLEQRWPADRAPRSPVLRIETSRQVTGVPEPAMLLSGAPGPDLLRDLEGAPLRVGNEARRVEVLVDREPGSTWISLTPVARLAPRGTFTLALGAWADDRQGRRLDAPFAVEFRVADGSDGGAVVADSWPADGTPAVPPNLAFAALRFDGVVRIPDGGVRLETAAGAPVPTTSRPSSCASVGWTGGTCVRLTPSRPLSPDTAHRLVVDARVVDETGAPVGPWAASFRTTHQADDEPPETLAQTCALDEETLGDACLLVGDRRLTLRVRATEPTRFFLEAATTRDAAVAPRGEASLSLTPLRPDTEVRATLTLVDLAGNRRRRRLVIRTAPPLAELSITEVRADPRGAEPAQEYVEVLNFARVPLDLDGMSISDRPDRVGDVITGSPSIPPGARALIVADRFDPTGPGDDAAPPGALLVRIGTSIASGGLSNSGESLVLRDAEGRRLSAAPATPRPRPGVCIVRVGSDLRSGAPVSFAYDADGGCTPGAPDRAP